LTQLRDALKAKSDEFQDIIKIGRRCGRYRA